MTLIMGVLNLTPDSFSDGGSYVDTAAAVARAREMVAAGAEIIDVGGESTRPGSVRVDPDTEWERIADVVKTLVSLGITVSVDTVHAATAQRAIAAGVQYINDVSGGLHDPKILRVVADSAAHYIAGHWRGFPSATEYRDQYRDVVTDVIADLADRVADAITAGIAPERIVLDPGLGFDKNTEQCWEILSRLQEFKVLNVPLLIGASRKRMLADLLHGAPPDARDVATAAVSMHCAAAGVWGVRVHNVKASSDTVKVAQKLHTVKAGLPADIPASVAQHKAPVADRITLTGLEVFAHHGVFDFEREKGQKFLIDATVTLEKLAGDAADSLQNTVHYGDLAEALHKTAATAPVDLIETLADRLVHVALQFTGVAAAEITVHKPEAPIRKNFTDVSITISREKMGEQCDR
ncbi:dihydropteroate synthase [Canibacter zhoujuaniae]|uniref:dihydropteroate synthase n=1 Tax=Canibacter zhoujuaniae TaxID=2708343 RepID=UPI001AB05D4D|nr:dihydropteroate synthase [Canibacter zhoujuaniae]